MNEEDIGGTGQFAGLNASDPLPAYKPPENSTRPGAAVASAPAAAKPADGPAASAPSVKPPSAEEIASALAAANANLASSNRSLEYRVDAATGISIVMIRNSQTGAVLQQMPGADVIALARMLAGWSPGKHMLLDLIA
jgi:flagellar protein FlaG